MKSYAQAKGLVVVDPVQAEVPAVIIGPQTRDAMVTIHVRLEDEKTALFRLTF